MVVLPPGLTSISLKKVAVLCGISRSGLKRELEARIIDTAARTRPLKPETRVLSIDLGIRNLALSLLTLSPTQAESQFTLHHWQRLDLTRSNDLVPGRADLPASKANGDHNAIQSVGALILESIDKEQFAPQNLSSKAYDLVQNHLLPMRPDYILLERQRFRSGSNPRIQEWTVRVNSLEAMLYATIATMQGLGHWKGEIIPMEPRSILGFLEETAKDAISASDTSGPASSPESESTKAMKIDLAGNALLQGGDVRLHDQAGTTQGTAAAYLTAWGRTRRRKAGQQGKIDSSNLGMVNDVDASSAAMPPLRKLDDLADSLVQGMTFFRWQQNLQRLKDGLLIPTLGIDSATSMARQAPRMRRKTRKASVADSSAD